MHRRILLGSLAALLAGWGMACENVPSDRVLRIDATGTISGLVYVDRNGTGSFDAADGRYSGLSVRLFPRGGGNSTATAVSDATGTFTFSNVAVGEYEIRIDNASLPDSLIFIKVDSASLHVVPGSSPVTGVNLSFASTTIRAARTLALGKRIFVEGVANNAFTTFGDSSVHVADSTGQIRATRVTPVSLAAGQRVRMLGTTALQDGQRTLTDVTLFVLGAGTASTPVALSTSTAAQANGGQLDAALVTVTNAVIVGSQTNSAQDVILSVNDGSGLLDIVIDRQSGIATGSLVPGASLVVTGLLVPTAAGVWQLKPRTNADVTSSFSTVTVAEARALPAGRVVTIQAVALNSWFSFADSTVHINDATGSLRAVRVQPVNLFAGDNVRLLGTIALRDGQPILTNVTASVLGPGVLPLPQTRTSAILATADSARLDAALVKVINATISATITVAGDFIMTVNDGSGPLDVVLDRDVGFALAPFVVGAKVDVTGVLVTTTGGAVWRLKPRSPADVVVR